MHSILIIALFKQPHFNGQHLFWKPALLLPVYNQFHKITFCGSMRKVIPDWISAKQAAKKLNVKARLNYQLAMLHFLFNILKTKSRSVVSWQLLQGNFCKSKVDRPSVDTRGFLVGTDRWALTDVFPAGVAVLCVQRLKAGAAVRPALFHDVTLAAQNSLTLETAKVLHVPVSALCLCALIWKNDLRDR